MNKFTQINVTRDTKRKIELLAPVLGDKIFELIETWTESAWLEAARAGLVNETMLAPRGNGNGQARGEEF